MTFSAVVIQKDAQTGANPRRGFSMSGGSDGQNAGGPPPRATPRLGTGALAAAAHSPSARTRCRGTLYPAESWAQRADEHRRSTSGRAGGAYGLGDAKSPG